MMILFYRRKGGKGGGEGAILTILFSAPPLPSVHSCESPNFHLNSRSNPRPFLDSLSFPPSAPIGRIGVPPRSIPRAIHAASRPIVHARDRTAQALDGARDRQPRRQEPDRGGVLPPPGRGGRAGGAV